MTDSAQQGPIGLVVKLPFATPEEFLARYGSNVTLGGIYLRSKTVKPPGTPVTLDLKLASGERILYATAVVHFVTGQHGQGISGMGLRFLSPDPETQRFLDTSIASLPHAQASVPPVPPGVGTPDYTIPPYVALKQGLTQTTGPATPVPIQISQTLTPVPMAMPAAPVPEPRVAPQGHSAPVISTSGPMVPTAPPFEPPKEEPKREGPIIGIDLGTTNSCTGYVRGGKPEVLRSREGHPTVPSILALNTRGKLVVGHPAKGQMLTNPRQTVYGAKRLVGRAFDSPIVQHIKDRFHYEIAPGENGEAAVRLGNRIYSLQQISALILREVREIAQNQLNKPVSRAVITVPAYYNDNQRQAVREAGHLAGLYVERILNEPTAAALAYGYGRKLHQRILVYDLGGGTFDASVMELHDNLYEVISTGGDTFLGGIDFDNAIVEYLLEEFHKQTGKLFQGDRVAMQRIHDAAERAKCALSERSDMRIHVAFVTMIDNKPYDLDVTLTRQKLIELTESLVDRTIEVCEEVLKAKGLSVADVQEVVLVGGQSRFPLVHEKITKYFGRPPTKNVHPDEAVALGAALLAHSLGDFEGVVLIDVLPMAIGVELPGGRFQPVLERNAPLPATKSYSLATSRDNQSEIELSIFQGDSDRVGENEFLGTLKLSGLAKRPRGEVRITVTFEVNNESLLKVTAKEEGTGREVSSTFSTRDTPEAVKARLAQQEFSPPYGTPTLPAGMPPPVRRAGMVGWLKGLFGRR